MDEKSEFEDFEIKTDLFCEPMNLCINEFYLPRLWREEQDHIKFNF
jgi:hypothetical protein